MDVGYLLDLIRWQATDGGLDLTPAKPRWEIYDRYLRILSLKKEGKTYEEIGDTVFSEEQDIESKKQQAYNEFQKAQRIVKELGRRI